MLEAKSKRRKERRAKVTLDFRLRKDLLVCETERSYSSIAASMARRSPALQEVKRNDFNTATARPVWCHSTRVLPLMSAVVAGGRRFMKLRVFLGIIRLR